MSIIPDFPYLIHGGDYNPDQWLERPEIIDEDFRLMDQAHCNVFSVGIFSWGQIEVEEGRFEFAWLDDIFERSRKSGKKLFLATPSAARPAWMGQKYPETSQMEGYGQRTPWGRRQNACLNSPIFREKVQIINRKLAERYATHSALAGWHINNEYSVECKCPLCRKKFHDFLRDRYKSLKNLNRHYWSAFWSHTITDWDQIDPDDQCINLVRLDWMRYLTQLHVEFFRMEIAAVRTFSDAPVTTNMMGLYGLLDDWKLAKECDFISDDAYPTWYPGITGKVAANFAALHDMHYSMLGKPFLIMESCPGIPNYKPYVRLRRPHEFQREMLLALGHGADGTMYFQWRKGRGNCEQLHGAVVGHDGTSETRVFQYVENYGKHLDNIAEIVDSKKEPKVAVVLDREARWGLEFAVGYSGREGKKTDETIFTHYRALSEKNIELAVIDSEQDFAPYSLVIAPMLYLIKDGVAEKMERFVSNGGTLVITYLSACIDESSRCFFGGNPGGPMLRRVFGVWSEEVDGLAPEDNQGIVYKGLKYAVSDFAEYLHAEGAEICGVYSGEFYAGTPALTVNSYGNGKAVYIGARTGLDFLKVFYEDILAETGIEPVLKDLPEGVQATRRIGKNNTYYFLLNMTDSPVRISLAEAMIDLWNGDTAPIRALDLPACGSTVLKR